MTRPVRYPREKIEGLLLGTCLGDAIGAPFDGSESDELPLLDHQYIAANPPKTYTDDTQMSISVFEEMYENGRIDQNSLLQRFIKRFSPWRGYSGGMLDVIEQWKDGQDIETAAKTLYNGSGSFGDGAAMRVAPISAFFSLNEVSDLMEQVRLCSVLTHTHPYGISGACLQAFCVELALNDVPFEGWLPRLFSFPMESVYKIKLETIKKCLEKESSPNDGAREIGHDADALDAVPAALFAVLRNTTSFADAVLFAVSMGGDTDTIGAMAGAIAGARWGLAGIPSTWLDQLENGDEGRDFIRDLIGKAAFAV
jgi:poly(ADP-ribose) glycohydrolase ARH3